MTEAINLRDTIIPKSDQLNADQLLAGPITITVTAVKRSDGDQPVAIHYEGDNGRPYKPGKSMRKVLIHAWGDDGREWVGRSMVLYNNPDVKFGGIKVGGIRISHLSHIDADLSVALTETKGKKALHLVKKLAQQPATTDHRAALTVAAECGTEALKAAWTALPPAVKKQLGQATLDELKAHAAQAEAKRAKVESTPVVSDPSLAALNEQAGGDNVVF